MHFLRIGSSNLLVPQRSPSAGRPRGEGVEAHQGARSGEGAPGAPGAAGSRRLPHGGRAEQQEKRRSRTRARARAVWQRAPLETWPVRFILPLLLLISEFFLLLNFELS